MKLFNQYITDGLFKNVGAGSNKDSIVLVQRLADFYEKCAKYGDTIIDDMCDTIEDFYKRKAPKDVISSYVSIGSLKSNKSTVLKSFSIISSYLHDASESGVLPSLNSGIYKDIDLYTENIGIRRIISCAYGFLNTKMNNDWISDHSFFLLTPDTIGKDPSNLSQFEDIFNDKGDPESMRRYYLYNRHYMTNMHIIIYGFKNLRSVNIDKLFGLNGFTLSTHIYIVDCPNLTGDVILKNTYICNKSAYNYNSIVFLPNTGESLSNIQLCQQLHLPSIKYISDNGKNLSTVVFDKSEKSGLFSKFSDDSPVKKQTTKSTTKVTPNSELPANVVDDSDLPEIVRTDDNKVKTIVDNAIIGKITRNGKNIYRLGSAVIWLTVGDDHVCRTKKGVALYKLV